MRRAIHICGPGPVPETVFPDPPDASWCAKQRLDYFTWEEDCQRRLKAKQKQSYCLTCEHWHWQDQLCTIAKVRAPRKRRNRT